MREQSQPKSKPKKASELGASFVEYALLVALISVTSIVGIQTFGQAINQKNVELKNEIKKAGEGSGVTMCLVGGVEVPC